MSRVFHLPCLPCVGVPCHPWVPIFIGQRKGLRMASHAHGWDRENCGPRPGRQLATMGRKPSATGWSGCPNRSQTSPRVGSGCRSTTDRRGCRAGCVRLPRGAGRGLAQRSMAPGGAHLDAVRPGPSAPVCARVGARAAGRRVRAPFASVRVHWCAGASPCTTGRCAVECKLRAPGRVAHESAQTGGVGVPTLRRARHCGLRGVRAGFASSLTPRPSRLGGPAWSGLLVRAQRSTGACACVDSGTHAHASWILPLPIGARLRRPRRGPRNGLLSSWRPPDPTRRGSRCDGGRMAPKPSPSKVRNRPKSSATQNRECRKSLCHNKVIEECIMLHTPKNSGSRGTDCLICKGG